MRMYDIILKKRDGFPLSKEEIDFFINEYTIGNIPDYQVSALMMAVYFQGMNEEETAFLTAAMAASGDQLDLSSFGDLSVDKHSTGGVGDKTTLIIAPIVAALGGKVSKMSGRGLGHTGGTVDKLESIPGYRTDLSPDEFRSQVETVGLAVIGQSGNLTPADKMLYALRDVTATIDSIPLITSSIMSKKLAAGSQNIVLDVKTGNGAFMKTPEQAALLAEWMVNIGRKCGRNVSALITNMDVPLGNAIGNSLEVREAVRILKGEQRDELYEVSVALATQMIVLTFKLMPEVARQRVIDCIESGKAFDKMKEWIEAQGGDSLSLEERFSLPDAQYILPIYAESDGYINDMDAHAFGTASVVLGAGRKTKADSIDHAAGILLHKKIGDQVCTGERIAELLTNRKDTLAEAEKIILSSISIRRDPPAIKPLIYKIIN